jgi:hypothetical protein
MMAITTSSSINVKPRHFDLVILVHPQKQKMEGKITPQGPPTRVRLIACGRICKIANGKIRLRNRMQKPSITTLGCLKPTGLIRPDPESKNELLNTANRR